MEHEENNSANHSANIFSSELGFGVSYDVTGKEKVYLHTSSTVYNYDDNVCIQFIEHSKLQYIGIYPEEEYRLQGQDKEIKIDDMEIDDVVKVPGRGNYLRRVS